MPSGYRPRHAFCTTSSSGQARRLLIAIPVRSWPCAEHYSWATVPSFDVTYRFLFFRHVAALPWGDRGNMLIMHAPYGKQGQPGVFCA